MKINIKEVFPKLIEQGFLIREGEIAGDRVYLVRPGHIGVKFTWETRIFRSSIWNEDGELVSAGFPKFVNLGENPENFPDPTLEQLNTAVFLEKIDGSLLIVSRYKGRTIVRTRGTFDATTLDNGWEITHLIKEYFDFFEFITKNDILDYSFLFEWTTPNNQIVIKHPKPQLTFLNAVKHIDYSLIDFPVLDNFANKLELSMPKEYYFYRKPLIDIVNEIKNWPDNAGEGICVYFKTERGIEIKKIKSDWYLKLHAFKSEMSLEKLLDIYLELDEPDYEEFCSYIANQFDYECLEYVQPWISKILDANRTVNMFFDGAKRFIERNQLRQVSRKDAAKLILSYYGQTKHTGILFSMLDNKPLKLDTKRALYIQALGDLNDNR